MLGKTIPPKDITLKVARKVPAGSFAAALARASPSDNLIFETIGNIIDKFNRKEGERYLLSTRLPLDSWGLGAVGRHLHTLWLVGNCMKAAWWSLLTPH